MNNSPKILIVDVLTLKYDSDLNNITISDLIPFYDIRGISILDYVIVTDVNSQQFMYLKNRNTGMTNHSIDIKYFNDHIRTIFDME